MSIYDMMAAYTRATGLPALGPHRNLTDYLIRRLSKPCPSCIGMAQMMLGDLKVCPHCEGLTRLLSPSAVRRLHQIIGARYPMTKNRDRSERTARAWGERVHVIPDRALDLNWSSLPLQELQLRPHATRHVATITWRRGLRSEFFWSRTQKRHSVLWEQIPSLEHADRSPWLEVFAWTTRRESDPERSAIGLLRQGWSQLNPAYGWLGQVQKYSVAANAFSTNRQGLMSARQLEWIFLTAVSKRRQSPTHDDGSLRPTKPRRVTRRSSNKNREPADIAEAFEKPTDNVISSRLLASYRARRNQEKPPHTQPS